MRSNHQDPRITVKINNLINNNNSKADTIIGHSMDHLDSFRCQDTEEVLISEEVSSETSFKIYYKILPLSSNNNNKGNSNSHNSNNHNSNNHNSNNHKISNFNSSKNPKTNRLLSNQLKSNKMKVLMCNHKVILFIIKLFD